jgi:hypothetical protein
MVDVGAASLHHPRSLHPIDYGTLGRNGEVVRTICSFGIIAAFACLLASGRPAQADTVQLGNMAANRILFLGNSITFCPQPASADWWGLTASTPEKDYAHLLTQQINAATGGSLAIEPPSPHQGDANNYWSPSYGLPNYNGNIVNMADIFERNFNTWNNARIQNQLDLKADIVVVQLGENLANGSNEQFRIALETMLTGLKNSSNPNIFVTGYILGSNPAVDEIKRQVCAEDSARRVFVDMSVIGQNPANIENMYGHPSDAGMAAIADTLFGAMATHSVPEPSSIALACTALVAMLAYAWKKRS